MAEKGDITVQDAANHTEEAELSYRLRIAAEAYTESVGVLGKAAAETSLSLRAFAAAMAKIKLVKK